MANTTNFNWETPDDTDLVKDGAAAMRTLGNSIDTSFVDLKGGTTGQVLSKASNTDLDYTWVTSDDANAIQNTIVDAKGDLIAATAADTPARLAVGANNTILIADSAEATGLKWGGAWQSWTPTLINVTIGNGTRVSRYQQIGKLINFQINITLGSTSLITGIIGFTLPVNPVYGGVSQNVWMNDQGVAAYPGFAEMYTDGNVYLKAVNSSGTYAITNSTSATVPFVWGNTDYLIVNGSYEAA